MKFGKTLIESSTPEWRTQFIDYKGLKKTLRAIKKKKARMNKKMQKSLALGNAALQIPSSTSETDLFLTSSRSGTPRNIAPELVDETRRHLRRPSISVSPPSDEIILPHRSISQTSLADDQQRQRSQSNMNGRERRSSSMSLGSTAKLIHNDSTSSLNTMTPTSSATELLIRDGEKTAAVLDEEQIVLHEPDDTKYGDDDDEASLSSETGTTITTSTTTAGSGRRSRDIRISVTFDNRILSQLSNYYRDTMLFKEESRPFFDLLEREVEKINKFYLKTEKECAVRHTKLVKQIQIYHYNFKKKNILSKLGRHSTSKQMIILGFQEHYRALVLLQNYRVLNYTGFTKILKKYNKCSGNSNGMKQEILSMIEDEPFYSSPMLNELIEQAEDLATEHLHNGNRKVAMDSLRVPGEQAHISQNVSFRCGLWLGGSVILTAVASYSYLTEYSKLPVEPDYSQFSFFVFRVLLFPILLMNFIAINLRIWDAARINYVFIFELDPRKHMSKHNFLEISLIAYLLWISFVQFFIWTVVNDYRWHFNERPWLYPIILTGCFVLVLLFPHPAFFNGNARMWLLKKLFNCLIAPFATVRFADFWLADQLTSMSEFLFEVQFVFCILPADFVSPLKTFCDQSQSLGVPLLNAWPLICRTLQCFRRYKDDRDKNHLINAGKYGSSIFVMLWAFLQKSVVHAYLPKLDRAAMIFFLISNVFSTMYKYYWDIVKDWGLFGFSKEVKYKGLRKEIVFKPVVYYVAIVVNLILRFLWVVVFALRLKSSLKLDMQYFLFMVAFAEIFRRFVWNIFRLENEHLNNCGKFRAVLDVPLPFEAPPAEEQEEEMKDSSASGSNKGKKKGLLARWGFFSKESPLHQRESPSSPAHIGTPTTISLQDIRDMPNLGDPESRHPETFQPRNRNASGLFSDWNARMPKSLSVHSFLSRVRKSPSMPALSSSPSRSQPSP